MRFRLDKDEIKRIEKKLNRLGFKKGRGYEMSDLIFEDRSWRPENGLEGYYVVRLRLRRGLIPLLELKERRDESHWMETSLKIKDPNAVLRVLLKGFAPSKIISKIRNEFTKKDIYVTLDAVKHLGDFIEIEGTEKAVATVVENLGLAGKERQRDYGYMMFQRMKSGEVSFTPEDMGREVAGFYT